MIQIPDTARHNHEQRLKEASESVYGFIALQYHPEGLVLRSAKVVKATDEYITLLYPTSDVEYNYKYSTFTSNGWYLQSANGHLRQQLDSFNEHRKFFKGNAGQIIATKLSPKEVVDLDGYHIDALEDTDPFPF